MDFLNETGGGIHHFGLMFDSVEKKERAAAFLRNANCEEVHRAQGITSSPEDQLYIFDARGLLGTFVELMTPVPFDDMPPARKVVMA